MRFCHFIWGIVTLTLCQGMLEAAPVAKPLNVSPREIKLDSQRSYRQLVVTGESPQGPYDLTRNATYRVDNPKVATVKDGRIIPTGDGATIVEVSAEGKTAKIPVTVANFKKPDPVRFKFETLATLTKQGCATGSCHGSPHGKGGFSLSLFGYDPNIDRISLTRDGFNRRVNVMDPAESLMLKKPLLEIPHVGGKRLRKTDASYKILKQWIYDGASVDLPKVECTKIVLTPGENRVLQEPRIKQQLSVLAYYSDGSVRDITAIATYDTSSANVVAVDMDGLVTGRSRGQAAISVRYLDKLQSLHFTVVENVPGFVWKSPAENNAVDTLVNAKLKQLQYLPSETCRDEEFLRRVSLDLTGMLPSPENTRQFLQDRSPNKRARLVDYLLETEEYARFQAMKLGDLMRITPGRLRDGRAEGFANWIVDSFRKNRPYDAFVRDILTATGDTTETPAANYFLAIPSMEERTEMTSQIFMGTRVECAKCHNHPFENWTQRDYYSIAAVFARIGENRGEIKLAGQGESLLPTTKEVMAPWGAKDIRQAVTADRRIGFSQWLTNPANPYFARVAVNRMWAALMGRGIVEPVDDFRSSNPPSNDPLLNMLANEFVKSGYDRKRILRLICNSQTYQRSSKTNRFNQTDDSLFSHARVRLLTAEQIQDAIGVATRVLGPPSTLNPELERIQKEIDARIASRDANYAGWLAEKEKAISSAKPKSQEERTKLTERITELSNIPTVQRSPKDAAELHDLLEQEVLSIPAEKRTERHRKTLYNLYLNGDADYVSLVKKQDGLANRMQYATQRPYPEESRFTSTFGQPARQTACTCERQNAPTLLQALELLNGGTVSKMTQDAVSRYATFDDKRMVEELYLSGFCRFPTSQESSAALSYLQSAEASVKGSSERRIDLAWSIINSPEFLFQH